MNDVALAARAQSPQAGVTPSTETRTGLEPLDPAAALPSRWWPAVVVGVLLSLPAGWLLSYAALLPFLLGLFFFVLIGLMIGAATFRVASKGRRPGNVALWIGTTLIVAAGWVVSIVKEGRDFPRDVARQASGGTRDLGGLSVEEFREKVADEVRGFLASRFAPGGTLGYIRWGLQSGEIRPTDVASLPRTIIREQRGDWLAVRLALSVGFFAFGVGSQTFSIRRIPTAPARPEVH